MSNRISPKMMLVVSVLLVSIYCATAAPRTITVDDDRPADFNTIQAAINDANDDDIVLVSPGHYYENIDFRGKAITVASTNPDDPNVVADTIIDANDDGIVVSFHMGEGPNSVIDGLTITGGYTDAGGGILCLESNPTIKNCAIRGNTAHDGGGIFVDRPRPGSKITLTRCTFSDNLAQGGMGGGLL
ncbi:MAG: right-handed parallel beta-helix repeat-containing protein [Planctomycetota bacterium]|jgi:hypothetical protein